MLWSAAVFWWRPVVITAVRPVLASGYPGVIAVGAVDANARPVIFLHAAIMLRFALRESGY